MSPGCFKASYSFLRFLLGSSSLEKLSLASLCWWVVTPPSLVCASPPPNAPRRQDSLPSPGYWYDAWSIAAAQQAPAEWQKADSLGGRGRQNGGLQPPDHAPASPAKLGCCLKAGPLPRRPGPTSVLSEKNFGLKRLRALGHPPSLAGDSELLEFTTRTQKTTVWNHTKYAWMASR